MLKAPQVRERSLGCAALPATCGELVQGLFDGMPCLVSCPIDHYGTATVKLQPEPGWEVPPDAPKAVAALRAGLVYLGEPPGGGWLQLTSDLPRGRGYGSSTADVGATLYALGQGLGRPLAAPEVTRMAVAVEPSDSTIFPGLVLFDHRCGSFHKSLGPAPSLVVIVLDPGGEVDTLAYNREVSPESLRRFTVEHREAFALLEAGLTEHDWALVGKAATLSARTHQAVLFNPLLEAALDACRALGGLGVCRAHSGTILGLLLDPARTPPHESLRRARTMIPQCVEICLRVLVDGGPR